LSEDTADVSEDDFCAFIRASVGLKLVCAFEMFVDEAESERGPAQGDVQVSTSPHDKIVKLMQTHVSLPSSASDADKSMHKFVGTHLDASQEGEQRREVHDAVLRAVERVESCWNEQRRTSVTSRYSDASSAVPTTRGVDGDAKWLDLRPDQLENMLNQYKEGGVAADGSPSQGLPQNIFDGIHSLLNGESSFEGIEHDDEGLDDEDVQLDARKFLAALRGTSSHDDVPIGVAQTEAVREDAAIASRLPADSNVEIHGLVSEAGRRWNGTFGKVVRFDFKTRRYVIELPNGGGRKKLKQENLVLSPSADTSGSNCSSPQRNVASAFLPDEETTTSPHQHVRFADSDDSDDSDDNDGSDEISHNVENNDGDRKAGRIGSRPAGREIHDEVDADMFEAASRAMDEELGQTDLVKSFVRSTSTEATSNDENHAEGDDEEGEHGEGPLDAVNLDLNLVQNLLQSYKMQAGLAGPASTILGDLGIALPDDDDDSSNVGTADSGAESVPNAAQ